MSDKTTSAETHLTGPERIWIQRYDKYAGNSSYFYFSPDNFAPTNPPVEFVRADLAINESPKSVDCGCGHNGNDHRTEEETGAARECSKCECAQFYNIHITLKVVKAERDSLARVNEFLVDALNATICHNCENRIGFEGKRQHENCPSCKPARAALALAMETK